MSASSPKKAAAKSKAPAAHPKYTEMITAAISTLKDRKGSSKQAIQKYMTANYNVSDAASVHIKNALKKGVSAGDFVQVKGTGASGSFKLAKLAPKKKKAAVKKPVATKKPTVKKTAPKKKAAAKKPAAKKASAPKKTTATKKPAAKKAAPKKPAAKKPAAKKAAPKKKVAAKKSK